MEYKSCMKFIAASSLFLSLFSTQLLATADACGNNLEARKLVQLIMNDAAQQRVKLSCNVLLAQAAKAKAELMAERGMVMHNLGGSPNSRLRELGYELPPYYGVAFSNQVEAIAGGYESAEEVWHGFKKSDVHADHLLARLEFYQEQDEIGVAYFKKWHSPHIHYWVVYVSKGFEPGQLGRFKEDEVPNKGNLILQKDTSSTKDNDSQLTPLDDNKE